MSDEKQEPKTFKATISGTEYTLVYDGNAIADAESLSGTNLFQAIFHLASGNVNFSELRGLFYALTRAKHPKLLLKDCGNLVSMDTMGSLYDAIFGCCAEAAGGEVAEAYRRILAESKAASRPVEAVIVEQEITDTGLSVVPPAPTTGEEAA